MDQSAQKKKKKTTLKVRKTKELIKKKTKLYRNLWIYTLDHMKPLHMFAFNYKCLVELEVLYK